MNTEKFLERWRSYGPTKQLAILLAVIVKQQDNGSISLKMSDLDDISEGQTVVYREDGDKIHLLFSPEFTNLYTIEDSLHERSASWAERAQQGGASPTPSAHSSNSHLKTDEELADLEEQALRAGRLRNQARNIRGVPLASPRPAKHRRPPSPSETRQQEMENLKEE